jgi:hypothetical protein
MQRVHAAGYSRGVRASHRSQRVSERAKKVVMRRMYMLGPGSQRLHTEIAAHVYTWSLTQACAVCEKVL